MAIGKKTGGRGFKPGVTGNPKGSSNLAREMGNIRKLNKLKVTEILDKLIVKPIAEVAEIANNKDTPAIDSMVASIIVAARKHGDYTRLNFLLDRLIGKVKDEVEHSFLGNINAAIVDKIAHIQNTNGTGGSSHGKKSKKDEQETSKEIVADDGSDDLPW